LSLQEVFFIEKLQLQLLLRKWIESFEITSTVPLNSQQLIFKENKKKHAKAIISKLKKIVIKEIEFLTQT